jgi:hypothetical protein
MQIIKYLVIYVVCIHKFVYYSLLDHKCHIYIKNSPLFYPSYYVIELTIIDLNRFSILKGLGIPKDQYIHLILIHQVKHRIESHSCFYTFEHYNDGQHTR